MSAVRADGLGKAYRVYERPLDRIPEWLGGAARHRLFWALRDVSFAVQAGSGCGIIGDNGAGKSTLLAILAGCTTPNAGDVDVRGRVGSILELGADFHAELTGRENVAIGDRARHATAKNGARVEEILAFSELGDFVDQPVRTYSSGMKLRLAFSLATAAEPDVLVVDEALSVGDQRFRAKCVERIASFVAAGGTLVLSSHDLSQVRHLCEKAVWLEAGRMVAFGPAGDVCDTYAARSRSRGIEERTGRAESGRPLVGVARVEVVDARGRPLERVACGGSLTVRIWLECDPRLGIAPGVSVGIVRSDGLVLHCGSTEIDGAEPRRSSAGTFHVALQYRDLPLAPGDYHVNLATMDNRRPLVAFEVRERVAFFRVVGDTRDSGLLRLRCRWQPSAEARLHPPADRGEHAEEDQQERGRGDRDLA